MARCNGSFPEKRKKRYVCLKYGSPCAPVLLPWLGEVQGTSLAMTRARLCQSQHIYSCSGWLRCSDGGRRQRCRWVSDGDFRRTPCTQFFSIHVPASQPHSLPPTECGCEVGPRTEKNWVHGIRRKCVQAKFSVLATFVTAAAATSPESRDKALPETPYSVLYQYHIRSTRAVK